MSWIFVGGSVITLASVLVWGVLEIWRCIKTPPSPEVRRVIQKINAAWGRHE